MNPTTCCRLTKCSRCLFHQLSKVNTPHKKRSQSRTLYILIFNYFPFFRDFPQKNTFLSTYKTRCLENHFSCPGGSSVLSARRFNANWMLSIVVGNLYTFSETRGKSVPSIFLILFSRPKRSSSRNSLFGLCLHPTVEPVGPTTWSLFSFE